MAKKRKYKIHKYQRSGKPGGPDPFYIKKAEAYSPTWEGEWASVQKRRKEKDPLMLGGQYRHILTTLFAK